MSTAKAFATPDKGKTTNRIQPIHVLLFCKFLSALPAKAKQLSRQVQLLTLWAADDELWELDSSRVMCDSTQSLAKTIVSALELVHLPLRALMYESGTSMSHVSFPTDSIVSLQYVMVGNEGVLGITLFLGGESTPNRSVVILKTQP